MQWMKTNCWFILQLYHIRLLSINSSSASCVAVMFHGFRKGSAVRQSWKLGKPKKQLSLRLIMFLFIIFVGDFLKKLWVRVSILLRKLVSFYKLFLLFQRKIITITISAEKFISYKSPSEIPREAKDRRHAVSIWILVNLIHFRFTSIFHTNPFCFQSTTSL